MQQLVFDAQEWVKTGDVGDNSQFWKPAKIIRTYFSRHLYHEEQLADVQFEDGRISYGHHVSAFRLLEERGS